MGTGDIPFSRDAESSERSARFAIASLGCPRQSASGYTHDIMPDDRSSSTSTHRSLLQRARGHDPDAWERMVALYGPLVLGWCRGWGLRDDDAADVFQEVFQSVAAHLAAFRRDRTGDTFRGWLRTITRNKVTDLHRRREKEPAAAGGSEARDRLASVPEEPPASDPTPDAAETEV